MPAYSPKVIEHFQNPRHVGRLNPYDGIGKLGDPDCGDFLEMTVRLSDDHKTISDIAFRIKGCPAAVATASVTAERAMGQTIEEAVSFTDEMIIKELDGLPPGKEHCSMLAVRGLHMALQNAMFRILFKRAGIVDSDEAFNKLVDSGEFDKMIHTCDGSCENNNCLM